MSGFLLFISFGFIDIETMRPLAAVLNTNFWLSTHVLCITTGYGLCILAAIIAHFYLWNTAYPNKNVQMNDIASSIKTFSILALLLTTIGTALGGIWADQSWGRFWGWDPKENGALLIILWLIWLLHGLVAKQLSELGFVTGIAFLMIIVSLAWFGVNLLNVGLHSYGFVEGIFLSLLSFILCEIIIIGSLFFIIKKKRLCL